MSQSLQGFRLSPQQHRLWSIQGGSGVFRARCEVEVHGVSDAAELRRAVDEVVARYEILRTRFAVPPGLRNPIQVIDPEGRWGELPTGSGDLPEAPPSGTGGEGEPVLWAGIESLPGGVHRVRLSLPALCADLPTLRLLTAELAAAWAGTAAEDGEETLQFADLAQWQNEALEDEEAAPVREAWRKRCAAARPLAATAGFLPERVTLELPASTAAALTALGERLEVPLEAIVLPLWQHLLERLGAADAAVVGVAFDGRPYEELAAALGPLARYLPMALERSAAGGLEAAAVAAAGALAEAGEQQDLFSWEAPGDAAAGTAVRGFPALLEVLPPPLEVTVAGARFRLAAASCCGEVFELRLVVGRAAAGDAAAGGLELALDHDPRRHGGDRGRGLLSAFATLLAGALERPRAPLATLPLLAPTEQRRVLGGLDASGAEPPRQPLHELVFAQAERTPEAVALVAGPRWVTYRELAEQARQVGRALAGRGVQPGHRVGLFAERGPELVAATLGVLATGAAFVPLDPTHPSARLAAVLEVSRLRAVLVPPRLAGVLPETSAELLPLDGGAGSGTPAGALPAAVPAEAVAYVTFTSGSTGRPKGVVTTHRGAANYLAGMIADIGLAADDVVLQMATPAFDASVRDTYGPLLVGARVVLLAAAAAAEPKAWLAALAEHGVTRILAIVPTTLRALLAAARESGGAPLAPRLRTVLASGEVLRREDATAVRELLGAEIEVVNQYGPTETTMTATRYRVPPTGAAGALPIGRPTSNYRLVLLDRAGQPVPAGWRGEIHLGGAGVSPGYLGEGARTAAGFLPDPFGAAGGRLYRTGDFGRLGDDGTVEFLGRDDQQVKVRGQRVELAEIETVLARQAKVQEAVVVLHRPDAGEEHLVAYLAGPAAAALDLAGLHEELTAELPQHMVPAGWLVLDTLPRLPNGKVDRRALPDASAARPAGGREVVAPRTPAERELAHIWSELLHVERVGAGDSFFALGGHSLLATQVVSRIAESFHVDLPLPRIFERPVLADLAGAVDELVAAGGGRRRQPIVRSASRGPVPLSFVQQRLWMQRQMGNRSETVRGPVRLTGPLDPGRLAAAVGRLVDRHDVLRSGVAVLDGRPHLAPSPRLPRLEVLDLAELSEPRRRAAMEQAGRQVLLAPFATEGPLARFVLVRLASEEHLLLVALDHLIGDQRSMRIVLHELMELYTAAADVVPELAPLPVQYSDFARWQREQLAGERLEQHLEFWRRTLAGAPPTLEHLLDRPDAARSSSRLDALPVLFEEDLVRSLVALAGRETVTPFMLLAAALAVVLGRAAGDDEVLFGTHFAGRNQREVENLVGLFASYMPLRISLAGSPTFRELLHRVRSMVLAAQDRLDLPYEKLESELGDSLDLGAARRVVLTLYDDPYGEMRLPGGLGLEVLRLQGGGTDGGRGRATLTLSLWEGGGPWSGFLQYPADLLDASRAEGMARHLEHVLRRIAAEPEVALPALDTELAALDTRRAAALADELAGVSRGKLRRRRAVAAP